MPELPSFTSRRSLPAQTSTPRAPLELGSQAPLVGGASRVTQEATELLSLAVYREGRLQEVEQTNLASQILQAARQDLLAFIGRLQDPSDPEFGSYSPNRKLNAFTDFQGKLYEEALKRGNEAGNIAGNYVATHLVSFLSQETKDFYNSINHARQQKALLDLDAAITLFQDVATYTDDEALVSSYYDPDGPVYQRLSQAVQAGLLSAREAAERFRTFKLHIREGRMLRQAIKQGADWFASPEHDQLWQELPQVAHKIDEQVRQAISAEQSQQEKRQRELDRIENDLADKNFVALLDAVSLGRVTTVDEVVRLTRDGLFKPEHVARLQNLVRQRHDEALTHSVAEAQFYSRLASPDPKRWPSDEEILSAAAPLVPNTPATITAAAASALIRYKRERAQQEQGRHLSTWDKDTAHALELARAYLRPFTGNIMEFDRLATEFLGRAEGAIIEYSHRHRDDPNAASPLSQVVPVIEPIYEALARQGRVMWEQSELYNVIRSKGGKPIRSLNDLNEARKKGEISSDDYISASQWLRLLEALDRGLNQSGPSTSPQSGPLQGRKLGGSR